MSPTPVLEGILNFRDVAGAGGVRTIDGRLVRTGRVFRAAALQWATPADLATLSALGIRSVLDLRTERELTEFGRADVDAFDAEFHHLPVIQTTWHGRIFENVDDHAAFLADRYSEMLHEGAGAIAKSLEVFARADALPAVFHCAAGKDRTGVLAAVLLGILGVSDELIADDYHATAAGMPAFAAMMRTRLSPERRNSMVAQPAAFLESPREAMLQFLALSRREHGSMTDWAVRNGVCADTLEALRHNLLASV